MVRQCINALSAGGDCQVRGQERWVCHELRVSVSQDENTLEREVVVVRQYVNMLTALKWMLKMAKVVVYVLSSKKEETLTLMKEEQISSTRLLTPQPPSPAHTSASPTCSPQLPSPAQPFTSSQSED